MSGLQIFNAHPALYIGQQSDFDAPSSDERAQQPERAGGRDGNSRRDVRYDRRPAALHGRRPVQARGFPGLGDGAELSGSRHRPALAFLLRLGCSPSTARSTSSPACEPPRLAGSGPERARSSAASAGRSGTTCGCASTTAGDYNVLQKLTYLIVIFVVLPLIVLTGMTMSPGLDAAFPWLVDLFGGRQTARTIHFICATADRTLRPRPCGHGPDLGRLEQPPLDDHRPLRHRRRRETPWLIRSSAAGAARAASPAVRARAGRRPATSSGQSPVVPPTCSTPARTSTAAVSASS